MKDKNKTKAELIKELKTLRKERGKSALNDLTEHKRAEDALKENEEKYRFLVTNIPDVVWTTDFKGKTSYISPNIEDIYGYTPEEVYEGGASTWLGRIHPKDVGRMEKAFKKLFEKGTLFDVEYRIKRKDGEWIWLHDRSIATYERDGVLCANGIFTDITERKQAEEELAINFQQQKLLTEISYLFTKLGKSEKNMKEVLRLLGEYTKVSRVYVFEDFDNGEYTKNTYEWCNKNIEPQIDNLQEVPYKMVPSWKKFLIEKGMVLSSNILELPQDLIDILEPQKIKSIFVLPIYMKDQFFGFIGFDECEKHRIWDKSEIEILKTVTNIVSILFERKQAEETLKQSKKNYRDLFNSATDAIYIQNRECRFLDVNQGAVEMYGYPKEFFIGKTPEFLSAPGKNDLKKIAGFVEDAFNGKPRQYDFWGIRKNGEIFPKIVRSQKGIYMGKEVVVTFALDITERKQAEEVLQESERRFRDVTENALEWVWEVDANGKYTYASPVCKKILGYKPEELLEKHFYDLFAPEEQEQLKKTAFEAFANKQPFREFINQNIHKSGRLVWMSTSGVPILDEKGNLLGYRGADMDITERKHTEDALRGSEEKFREMAELLPEVVYECDAQGIVTFANKAAVEKFGFTQGDFYKGVNALQFIAPDDRKRAGVNVEKIFRGIKRGPFEYIAQRKDGSEFPIITYPSPIIRDGKPVGLRGIVVDITERKQAEENVKNIKDELEIILDSVPAIIFYKDTEGRIVRANKTLANSLKMPVKDIVGKTTEELFPKEQAENMRKDDKEVIVSGKPKRDIIEPYTTPDGLRWLTTDKIPYKDKKGKVTGVIGLAKDITVQRKAEQKVKQTYQRLKKTIDAAIDTMSRIIEAKDPYTSDHQHRVCQLAVHLAQELGLAEDKVEGIRIASLIHDIGKIGLPTEILSKPGKLSDIEFSLIKDHSQTGYDILKSIDFSYPVDQIVLQHHERINGSGYPNNLKGNKILLEAKIIGVADVVEAMSSFRPYRPALGIDKALEEITQNKGILYDPEVVDACFKLFKEKKFKFE